MGSPRASSRSRPRLSADSCLPWERRVAVSTREAAPCRSARRLVRGILRISRAPRRASASCRNRARSREAPAA
ncbi:Hypothetical protein A7982_10896 [Minicystis rosea]|nr:Hypothetical protein A7982_10896 [Minicystis rosea]